MTTFIVELLLGIIPFPMVVPLDLASGYVMFISSGIRCLPKFTIIHNSQIANCCHNILKLKGMIAHGLAFWNNFQYLNKGFWLLNSSPGLVVRNVVNILVLANILHKTTWMVSEISNFVQNDKP